MARVSVAMLRLRLGTNEDAVSGVVDVPNRPTLSLSSQRLSPRHYPRIIPLRSLPSPSPPPSPPPPGDQGDRTLRHRTSGAPIFFSFFFARPEVTRGMCEKMQKCGVVKSAEAWVSIEVWEPCHCYFANHAISPAPSLTPIDHNSPSHIFLIVPNAAHVQQPTWIPPKRKWKRWWTRSRKMTTFVILVSQVCDLCVCALPCWGGGLEGGC